MAAVPVDSLGEGLFRVRRGRHPTSERLLADDSAWAGISLEAIPWTSNSWVVPVAY
jgi:hypothetical protein